MFKVALPLLFIASIAQAHVEPGTYTGKTATGETCVMIAKGQYFENKTPHPLNERIQVEVNGNAFVVGHPPIIDAAKAIAFFNHDVFHGVLAISGGARALEIRMMHTEEFEGPAGFTLIENKWSTDTKTSIACENLVFTP